MSTDIIDAEVIEDPIFTIEDETPITPRQQHIKELRDLLNLLEANPDLPMPADFGTSAWNSVTFYPETPVNAARLVKELGGRWEKNNPNNSEYDATYLRMKAKLGLELHVDVIVSREGVCEKKVVGTQKKKVQKVVVEQVTEEVYEDVDVIEFQCKSLMSLADQKVMDELESIAS